MIARRGSRKSGTRYTEAMNVAFGRSVDDLPFLTAALPGVGGVIKRYNEDFVVEEVPLYTPSGEGTHVYFTIEKQGMTTPAAVQQIARRLGRNAHDIGFAGMKDAHAITRQMMSVEHIDPQRVAALEMARLRVLSVTRHTNKLKLGHLAGNRFILRIRETVRRVEEAEPQATAILDILVQRGVPNYFGPQRFGARGDNALIGRAVVRNDLAEAISYILGKPGPVDHGEVQKARELFDAGDYEGAAATWPRAFGEQTKWCRVLARGGSFENAWRSVNHTLRKLYFSAFQSDLFNQVLARRIEGVDRVLVGDLAWKHRNGACFRVEDATVEQPRCDIFEISPTGPLHGRRMTEALHEPGLIEAEVLAGSGVTREELDRRGSDHFDGGRRPLRVPIDDPRVEPGKDDRGPYLELQFMLPAGSYATNVTREITKRASGRDEERE